jgi:hypothetical protein
MHAAPRYAPTDAYGKRRIDSNFPALLGVLLLFSKFR